MAYVWLIEGVTGAEVVADYFVVAGFRNNLQDAIRDHNQNLVPFLQRCSERGVKLSAEKPNPLSEEVSLSCHYASRSGVKIHPEKVRAGCTRDASPF